MSDINDPRKIAAAEIIKKKAYQDIARTPAMLDHLEWLESWRLRDMRTAESEDQNPARRAVYLQSSMAYARVKAHLEKLTSPDEPQSK